MFAIRSIVSASLVLGASSAIALVDTAALPEPVRAPDGHSMKLWSVGKGEITYECKAANGQHAWAFVSPDAVLYDENDEEIGTYYGGPTWEADDGSKVTGKELATEPGGDGNIPLQLVRAEPAEGEGAMMGVSYIQRLNTKGGVAPSSTCDAGNVGAQEVVDYEADYVFYHAD